METAPNKHTWEAMLAHAIGRITRIVLAASVLYVAWLIVTPYPHYLPADLTRGFLRNKSEFFYNSAYGVGFYAHILSAPLALMIGTAQMSRTIRRRCPRLHMQLGKLYCLVILCFAAPGGLIMSMRAFGGIPSILCFSTISLLAWWFTLAGWLSAKRHQYPAHGRWMMRSYLMMCSAISLRLTHYLLQPLGLSETLAYQLSAWLSWLPWLLSLECVFVWWSSSRRPLSGAKGGFPDIVKD